MPTMSSKDFIREHKRLIKVLVAAAREGKKQQKELKSFMKKQ